ncbi:MAG: MerR family transcriptional regulator, partial [Terriglobales bacterium]
MKIGELATQAGVSVQTVRFYERRRLMRAPRRTSSGYRMYGESDLEILRNIKRMQRFGFTLTEARRVLRLFALPGDAGEAAPYPRG